MSDERPHITIYTDGACSGNPGPGGWGASLISGDHRREIKGGESGTTNNRMELMAAIMALETLKKSSQVDLHTDSQYVRKGITEWIHGWKRNGWKTAAKKPVKNADLWQRLDLARARHQIEWHWVKGHAGDPENERADELARLGMNSLGDDDGEKSDTHPAELLEGGTAETDFSLDTQLEKDTLPLTELPLCSVRLMNDSRLPWLILVPRRLEASEMNDLDEVDSTRLMQEIRLVSSALQSSFGPDKLNVAALGNIVSQLHVHVMARWKSDFAWPAPVFGIGEPQKYDDATAEALCKQLRTLLNG